MNIKVTEHVADREVWRWPIGVVGDGTCEARVSEARMNVNLTEHVADRVVWWRPTDVVGQYM